MDNKKIKNATPKEYNGIKFRSKLEADIAKILDFFNIGYEYEQTKFILQPSFKYALYSVKQISYTPDFIIGNLILECKGFPSDSWKIKRKLFLNYLAKSEKDYIFVEIKSYKDLLNLIDMDDRFITKNILVTNLKDNFVGEFNSISEALEVLNLTEKSKGNIQSCLLKNRKSAYGYKWNRVERELELIEGEEWRDVIGFEGLYKVSNKGRVVSSQFHGEKRFKLMSLIDVQGYKFVKLRNWYKKIAITYPVHRLVAEAFIPNLENKPDVDHINTIRDDNSVENLMWVTPTENMKNPITNERVRQVMIKLNKEKVGPIASGIKRNKKVMKIINEDDSMTFNSLTEAAKYFKVYPSTIQKWCAKNKNGWKYEE